MARREITQTSAQQIIEKMGRVRFIRYEYVAFLRNELGTETVFQLTGQIILLLLAQTETPTVTGFQTMFQKSKILGISSDVLLSISIMLSLKTCFSLHLKSISQEKPHFPFTAKATILLFAILGTLQRVAILVAYFFPFFGHLSLLQHWQAEQIPWASRETIAYHSGKAYLNKTVNFATDTLHLPGGRTVAWAELNRANYEDPEQPTPPSYTLYTGLSLGEAFAVFGVILLLHVTTVIAVKRCTVHRFCQRKTALEMIVHGLENTNLAYPAWDWDHITGDVAAHRRESKRVAMEILLTLLTNFCWSVVMLAPLFLTSKSMAI